MDQATKEHIWAAWDRWLSGDWGFRDGDSATWGFRT